MKTKEDFEKKKLEFWARMRISRSMVLYNQNDHKTTDWGQHSVLSVTSRRRFMETQKPLIR